MGAAENKQLMQDIFAEMAKGNGKLFVDSLADDFRWTIAGATKWSRTYEGKQAVLTKLLRPLFSQFADTYTATAHRFIAEDDYVVVEFRGRRQDNVWRPGIGREPFGGERVEAVVATEVQAAIPAPMVGVEVEFFTL